MVAAALGEILLNNGNKGGAGLDGLLGSALGINLKQLVVVRVMVTENQGITDIIPRYRESWYYMGIYLR